MTQRRNNWLLDHRRVVASQLGEDGILEKIFELITTKNKWCVEFGAADGHRGSNTWNFINNHGWHSVQIEPDPHLFDLLHKSYEENTNVVCLNREIDFQGANTLDAVLSETPLPHTFDLLSVDIDGNDYHIWNSLEKYFPRVVVIEYNPTIPTDIEFVQEKDMGINQGSSLLSLYRMAKKKGYELVSTTDWNAIFVMRVLYPVFQIADNIPQAIHKNGGKYETRLFQLFDGTLVLAGYKKLFWHDKREIRDEDIQVLPPDQRIFPSRRKPSSA